MHLAHAALLNFSVAFRQKPVYNEHTLLGFLPVQYGERGTLEGFEKIESLETGVSASKSKLAAVESCIAPMKGSEGHDEKIKILHNEMCLILYGFCTCQEEGFGASSLTDSCWKLFPVMISYCCDMPEGIYMSFVYHGATARLCIWSPVNGQEIRIMETATRWNMEVELRAWEEFGSIISIISGMKRSKYKQGTREEVLEAQ